MPKVSLPPSQIREPGRLRGSERAPWRAGATERGRSARSDARARGASLDQPLDEALLPLCILNRARDVAHAPLEPRRLVRGAIKSSQVKSSQVKSSHVKSSQVKSSQVKSSRAPPPGARGNQSSSAAIREVQSVAISCNQSSSAAIREVQKKRNSVVIRGALQ